MVQRLLDFKNVANSIVTEVFVDQVAHPPSATSQAGPSTNTPAANHNQFSYALIDAFQTGFKARRNKPAEMVAKYMDKAMREPNRAASDTDFVGRMDAVLALYRFTDDKDVFRTFYHRALAKRLLLGRSASDDDEKIMLKKLKERAFSSSLG
jgi:cullin-4